MQICFLCNLGYMNTVQTVNLQPKIHKYMFCKKEQSNNLYSLYCINWLKMYRKVCKSLSWFPPWDCFPLYTYRWFRIATYYHLQATKKNMVYSTTTNYSTLYENLKSPFSETIKDRQWRVSYRRYSTKSAFLRKAIQIFVYYFKFLYTCIT